MGWLLRLAMTLFLCDGAEVIEPIPVVVSAQRCVDWHTERIWVDGVEGKDSPAKKACRAYAWTGGGTPRREGEDIILWSPCIKGDLACAIGHVECRPWAWLARGKR